MLENHKLKIDSSDVVSFDVFDTLLTRTTVHPKDIFSVARELFNEHSRHLFMDDFYAMRVKAEEEARKRSTHKVEITLDEIYEIFGELFGYDKEYCDELKEYELKAERLLLVRDMSTFELYEYAKRQGKTIIIISDMYLSRKEIEGLLRSKGVDVWSDLILSSEDQVAKFSGSSFAEIVRRYPDKKVLHVGDNIHSDISWAHKFGFDTIHKYTNVEELSFEKRDTYRAMYGGDRYRFTLNKESINVADAQFNILSGLAANYCLNNKTPYQAIGYSAFGPLLLGFVQWINEEIKRLGSDHLYFLARDGAIMQQAYNLYYDEKERIPNTYTIGSRRVLNFPSLHAGNFSVAGISSIVGPNDLDVRQTLRYYGVDPSNEYVKKVLQRVGLENTDVVTFGESVDKFKAVLLILEPMLLLNAEAEKKNILKYLKQIKLSTVDRPIVCDIGWNGSMQEAISALIGKEVSGLYFGIHNTQKARDLGAAMSGYFDTRMRREEEVEYEKMFLGGGVLILESLFTNPDQASLIGLKQTKDGFVGVEGDHETSAEERARVREIHEAALQFIADFKRIDLPMSLRYIRRDVAIRPFEWMVANPTDIVAQIFGTMKYAFVASSVPLYIGAPAKDKAFYDKNRDALQEEYKRAVWKEGFRKNCEILGIALE